MGQAAVPEGEGRDGPDASGQGPAGGLWCEVSRHLMSLLFDCCLHHVTALPIFHLETAAAVRGLGKLREG